MLYKPHPLTGNRDRSMLAVHNAIATLIERANEKQGRAGTWSRKPRRARRTDGTPQPS